VLTTQKASFDCPLTLEIRSPDKEFFQVEEIKYLKRQSSNTKSQDKVSPSEKPFKRWIDPLIQWTRNVRQSMGTGALLSIRLLWIRPAVNRAIELNEQDPLDFMISTFGPPATHMIAGILKKKYPNLFWVADYRDLWNDFDEWDSRKWPFSAIENFVETYYVSRADLLTTVSDPLRDILHTRFQKPAITIENGFDLDDLDQYKPGFFKEDGKIRLAYTGKIRAEKRDPTPLFKAVKLLYAQGMLTKDNFEILFFGNELGHVPTLIQSFGLSELVATPGFVDRSTSLSIQKSVDALIFLDWTDPEVDGILTGKLFEYLYSGTPIIGIGSRDSSAAGDIIQASGCGVYLGKDVNKITQIISGLMKGKSINYCPNMGVLEQFDRKKLAYRMLDAIAQSLK
jgi:glycosyltransferase involved in cell wall biosynthesis